MITILKNLVLCLSTTSKIALGGLKHNVHVVIEVNFDLSVVNLC